MLVVNLLMPLRLDSFALLDIFPKYFSKCFSAECFFLPDIVTLFGAANNSTAIYFIE